ncbi:MAG: phosphoribosylglycinamide formyltransferase [Clostridia bacterium]|nr:phosphoribosylglycinamide formyltransferase [Clostridia bacterium]
MKKIGVLVSGGGTNLQAILDAEKSGIIKSGSVVTVVSNKKDAFALKRAENAGVEGVVIERKAFDKAQDFDRAIVEHMKSRGVDLIVMAGFLCIVGEELIKAYPDKIINIHPSLIPSFCGAGFYGLKVHKAALDYGVKVSGATVHFVNGVVDGGKIIAQKAVYVEENDTPETLQRRIMEQAEWVILPQAIEKLCSAN